LLFAARAVGQTAPLDQKEAFVHFLLSPSAQKFIERSIADAENQALKTQCSTLKVLEANKFDIIDQPVFEQRETGLRLKSGSWVSVAKVDRCGVTTTRRLYIKYLPDQNRFEVSPLLPGDFRGNLKLEADARRIVVPGLMAAGHCADRAEFYLLDVKALGAAMPQGWSETWSARACGKSVSATVSYNAIPGGMDIAAEDLKAE
jgi:hypothetical protein